VRSSWDTSASNCFWSAICFSIRPAISLTARPSIPISSTWWGPWSVARAPRSPAPIRSVTSTRSYSGRASRRATLPDIIQITSAGMPNSQSGLGCPPLWRLTAMNITLVTRMLAPNQTNSRRWRWAPK
jgi:hypothetical protein